MAQSAFAFKYLNSFHTQSLKYLLFFTQLTKTKIQLVFMQSIYEPGYGDVRGEGRYRLKRISSLWVLCVQVWDEQQSHLSHDSGRHLAALHIWGRSRGQEERVYTLIAAHFTAHSAFASWCWVLLNKQIGKHLLNKSCIWTRRGAIWGQLRLCVERGKTQTDDVKLKVQTDLKCLTIWWFHLLREAAKQTHIQAALYHGHCFFF